MMITKYNFIDKDGDLIIQSPIWITDMSFEGSVKMEIQCTFCKYSTDYVRVLKVENKYGLYNLLTENGEFVFNEWFNRILPFHKGLSLVQNKDYLWNFVTKKGEFLSDEWYDVVNEFKKGFAKVYNSKKLCNLLTLEGTLLSDEQYKDIGDFKDGFAEIVRPDDTENFLTLDGKVLYPYEWFRYVTKFNEGTARVQRMNGTFAYLDKQGKLNKI